MSAERIGFIVQKARGAQSLVTVMGELVPAKYRNKKDERVVLIIGKGKVYKKDELDQAVKDLETACLVEGIAIIKKIPVTNARFYYESGFKG